MNLPTIAMYLIALAIIITSTWNIITFSRFKKASLKINENLNDSKYYELKYKHEFLIAVVLMITFIAGFLGYKTKQDLEAQLMQDFNQKVDSIKNELTVAKSDLNKAYTNLITAAMDADSLVTRSQTTIKLISRIQENQRSTLDNTGGILKRLTEKVSDLSTKKILNQAIFVVKDLQYKYPEKQQWQIFKFTDLENLTGEKLPIFKLPPAVIISANENAQYVVKNVTSESFEVLLWGYSDGQYTFKFNLVIIVDSL